MKKFIAFVLLGLLVASCHDAQKESYLAEVEQMNNSLDSIEEVFESNKIDTINLFMNHIEYTLIQVKNNFVADTVDAEFAKVMDRYKSIKKGLPKNNRNAEKISKSIIEERTALEKLEHDIENAAGEREKYPEYISFERNKVVQIRELMKSWKDVQDNHLEAFDRLDPIVQNFVDSIK